MSSSQERQASSALISSMNCFAEEYEFAALFVP